MERKKGKLILDGNALYEIDSECAEQKKKSIPAPQTRTPGKENSVKEEEPKDGIRQMQRPVNTKTGKCKVR